MTTININTYQVREMILCQQSIKNFNAHLLIPCELPLLPDLTFFMSHGPIWVGNYPNITGVVVFDLPCEIAESFFFSC